MPTGPKGQRRPADVIGNAIKVASIATVVRNGAVIFGMFGQVRDDFAEQPTGG